MKPITLASLLREALMTDPTNDGRDALHAWLSDHASDIARALSADVGKVRAILADGKTWGRDQDGPAFVRRVGETLRREAKRLRSAERDAVDAHCRTDADALGLSLRSDVTWPAFGHAPDLVRQLERLARATGQGDIAIVHGDGAYTVDARRLKRACEARPYASCYITRDAIVFRWQGGWLRLTSGSCPVTHSADVMLHVGYLATGLTSKAILERAPFGIPAKVLPRKVRTLECGPRPIKYARRDAP